jgi:hypothetical protein
MNDAKNLASDSGKLVPTESAILGPFHADNAPDGMLRLDSYVPAS